MKILEKLEKSLVAAVDQQFFVDFGERVSALRKMKGLTQSQLGEVLGVTQQQVHLFERGRRRIPISSLPPLAECLGVTLDELLGTRGRTTRGRGRKSSLEKQLERYSKLPRSEQRFVSRMIEAALQQAEG